MKYRTENVLSEAYCSASCEGRDAASTPTSSSSSAFPSPMVHCADGEDVPALVPSALGLALQNYSDGNRDSVSSSSASSKSWDALEDDQEEDNVRVEDDYSYHGDNSDSRDSMYDTSSQSSYTTKRTGLSYARRPSNTNNHSALPSPHHQRASSRMKLRHISQSVPNTLPIDGDDESESAASSPSADNEGTTISQRRKKVRGRGSLPNYFALLQMSTSPEKSRNVPGVSKPSLRPNPSPPKVPQVVTPPTNNIMPRSIWDIARGRQEHDGIVSSRSVSSSPPARSGMQRARFLEDKLSALEPSGSQVRPGSFLGKGHETTMDRGRPRRRNSSPPRQLPPSSTSRGRLRAEELDGRGCSPDAPGYGIGRSGLQNRGRERERDGTVGRGSLVLL